MYSKIIKSFYRTSIYLLVFLILVLSSCYTQVDMSSFENSKLKNDLFQNEFVDPNIIGTWQKTKYVFDSPPQVQDLIFDYNRNCLFKENSEYVNGKTLSGNFHTKDSILTVRLDYGYGTEKYSYKVAEGKLTLIPIGMNRRYPYKISGSGGTVWTNPYFDKSRQ